MKRACANCIYFATIQIYRCKPFNWCALGMIRIKGKGYKFCPAQTPLPPPKKNK